MAEAIDVNYFVVNVSGTAYNVTVSYQDISISRFMIEVDCKYLFTLYMDEQGRWKAEKDVPMPDENLVEQIGRAIEEYDAA